MDDAPHPATFPPPASRGDARRAVIGSAVGYAMDGFDLLILGFMLRPIAAGLHLGVSQGTSLVTGTLLGAVAGGIAFGMLSDRLGRVRVLSWTILLFAAATGLSALARGYWDLLACRTAAGIGLGGEFGIGMALVAETWPAAKQARAASWVGLGWQAGVLAAALLTPLLLPVIGWRGMFAMGMLPALAAFAMRRSLHEPGQGAGARPTRRTMLASLRLLVADGATARVTAGLTVLCSVQNFGYYGVMIWMPSFLSARFGYTLTRSALWTATTVFGMALGIAAFGQIADRLGRRPAFLAYMLGAAGMVVVYSRLSDPAALLVAGAVMGFFVNGMLGGYGALMSALYPTEIRATAQNMIFNLGRAVGGCGPLVVGAVSAALGFSTAIALLALLYLVDIAALMLLIPDQHPGAGTLRGGKRMD